MLISKSEVKQENGRRDKDLSAEGMNVPGPGKLIPVYVMGKQYMVPETLTIMKAMEYAGGLRLPRRYLWSLPDRIPESRRIQASYRAGLPDGGRAGHVPGPDTVLSCQPCQL